MEYIFVIVAFSAGVATILAGFAAVRLGDKLKHGVLPYYSYFLLFATAELISRSNRSLDQLGELGGLADAGSPGWIIKFSSLVGLISVLVVLYRRFLTRPEPLTKNQIVILVSFVALWLTSYLIPLLFAYNSAFSGSQALYLPLVFGAALIAKPADAMATLMHIRWAIFGFVLISYLGAVAVPETAFFFGYADSQGYLPGVPRFYGLAPHALGLGALTVAAIWLFIFAPAKNKAVNRCIMVVLWTTLILTQAKTALISCILGCAFLLASRKTLPSFNAIAASPNPVKNVYAGLMVILFTGITALVLALSFGGLDKKLAEFESSDAGARLTSLTGRDEIWDAALSEWRKNPVLGYGNQAFSRPHAVQLGLPHANNAHNQYYDTLVRSGLVGLCGMLVYLAALLGVGLRSKSPLGLFLTVLVLGTLARTITDLPFSASGSVGFDNIHQFLIHLAVAACGMEKEKAKGGAA